MNHIPQDHAYFASLYKFAVSNNINTIFSGGNIATEGIAPDFMYDPLDLTNYFINSSYGTTLSKLSQNSLRNVTSFIHFIIS